MAVSGRVGKTFDLMLMKIGLDLKSLNQLNLLRNKFGVKRNQFMNQLFVDTPGITFLLMR